MTKATQIIGKQQLSHWHLKCASRNVCTFSSDKFKMWPIWMTQQRQGLKLQFDQSASVCAWRHHCMCLNSHEHVAKFTKVAQLKLELWFFFHLHRFHSQKQCGLWRTQWQNKMSLKLSHWCCMQAHLLRQTRLMLSSQMAPVAKHHVGYSTDNWQSPWITSRVGPWWWPFLWPLPCGHWDPRVAQTYSTFWWRDMISPRLHSTRPSNFLHVPLRKAEL